jgi:1-acyl-sn-glycerol-3-phosphate acyltransferase
VRACQENAMRLLEEDKLVAVFPEGSQGTGKLFKNRYKLQRFGRGGFIKLALRARAPVVPVAVVGAEETQPVFHRIKWLSGTLGFPNIPVTPTFPLLGPLGLLPLPAKWRIEFGEPLDLAGEHDPSAADDRLLVTKLAEDVRGRIQSMLDDALASRRARP